MRGVVRAADTRAQIEEALTLLASSAASDAARSLETLYARWYARPCASYLVPSGCPPDLAEMLRAAHAGSANWEQGWRVQHLDSRGRAAVRRGNEVRVLEVGEYLPATRRGLLPRPGDTVAVVARCDRVAPGDGWWRTAGSAWTWDCAPRGIVRLYFNCRIAGLGMVVGGLTRMLVDEPTPWLLKCATDPSQYARGDAIVAYLMPRALERYAAQMVELAGSSSTEPPEAGPALTLPVARGLSAAFDPGGNESFGAHRCRLIAEAANDGVQGVLARFAAEGVRPERPWAHATDPRLPWEHT